MFCNEIGWHNLQIRQVLENWQIVQCNLQIGWPIYQLADWPGQFVNWPDWTDHLHVNFDARKHISNEMPENNENIC